MVKPRLHGTDGIRGRVDQLLATAEGWNDEHALEMLVNRRLLCNRSMRIIGEATGLHLIEVVGDSPLVLIGWDRRDGNKGLVDALESGLCVTGCRVLRIGEVPTPGIHHAIHCTAADAGMMVTASHNPAHDSGVKLFDQHGYKSMPDAEDHISSLAWMLADGGLAAPQELGEKLDEIDGLKLYRSGLKMRLDAFESLLGIYFEEADWNRIIPSQGLVLDSSGGAAADWLDEGLTRRGLLAIEVSSRLDPINENCGAGGFSPTDEWSNEELMLNPQEHRLLWTLAQRLEQNDGMPPWFEGQLIGAALDGDGDRCLLIEATSNGVRVVDGDRMCDDFLRAVALNDKRAWKMAASIESDLGLSADLKRFEANHISLTTAVGDRWLSQSLSPQQSIGKEIPALIGTEDSGHLVMAAPCPIHDNAWNLVGDGAATLLAALMSRICLAEGEPISAFKNGWKKRVSIQPSERQRWTGDNELAQSTQELAENWCGSKLERIKVEGESSLLLLSGEIDDLPISVAIRNSGTEAKTAVSVRFSAGVEANGDELVQLIVDALEPHLKI
ncbi:MAG: hypothetical protein VX320_03960 [Candidatus Thermoplasmatota archaeon]|nr:hypothetical protein [Candidatus Thermoplasmatota archaeon]